MNLISRKPAETQQTEFLLNATTRNGQDVTPTHPRCGRRMSYLPSSAAHRQERHDLDDDGWIDTPGYERFTARPRLFWESANGANALITFGAMTEDREGGTLPGRLALDGQLRQFCRTVLLDGGAVGRNSLSAIAARCASVRFGDDVITATITAR